MPVAFEYGRRVATGTSSEMFTNADSMGMDLNRASITRVQAG